MNITVINLQCENLTISKDEVLEFFKKHSSSILAEELSCFTELKDAPEGPDVTLFYPCGEGEPAYIVDKAGDLDGTEVSSNEYGLMMAAHACVGIYVEYPDSSQYGTPEFVQNDINAKKWVANDAGVTCVSKAFALDWFDRGDDGGTHVWLTLRKLK